MVSYYGRVFKVYEMFHLTYIWTDLRLVIVNFTCALNLALVVHLFMTKTIISFSNHITIWTIRLWSDHMSIYTCLINSRAILVCMP